MGASTLFLDHFTGIKWVLFFILVPVFCFHKIFTLQNLKVPVLTRGAYSGLGLVLFGIAANLISCGRDIYLLPYATLLISTLLIFCVSQISSNEVALVRGFKISFLAATAAALAYLALQKAGVEIFPQLYTGGIVGGSLFGNSGMAAEWISVSILFQWYELRGAKGRGYRLFLGALLVSSACFLITSSSRGAIIGLASAAGFLFWETSNLSSAQRRLGVFSLGILCVVGLGSLYWFDANKAYSQNERIARWENTIAMITDHPLGTGPGSFLGAYLNYSRARKIDSEVNELILIDHPHNEYLRVAAEYGVIVFLAFFGLGIHLLRNANRRRTRWTLFLTSAIVFLGVDGLVNGAFSNPSVLFVFCLIAGGLLRELPTKKLQSQVCRKGMLAVVSLLFFIGIGFSLAKWSEAHPQQSSERFAGLTCEMFPSVWQNCLSLGMSQVSRGEFHEAQTTFKNILGYNPNNFLALKSLAYAESEIGHKAESCRLLGRYMETFNFNSRYIDVYKTNCK